RLPAGDDDRDLALRRIGETARHLECRPSHHLLELLRHLAADGDGAVRQSGRQRPERRRQAPRRLERDDRPRPARELLPERVESRPATGQVPEELVPLGGKPARDERGLDRGRARQHRHRHPGCEGRCHEARAGVADRRQAGVRDERHSRPGLQPGQHLRRALRLVVLVIARQRRRNPVPLQEDARPPRVLAEDEVGLAELAEDAQRDVLEVADRRRADRQRHQAELSSASKATIAAPIIPASVPSCARVIRYESRIETSTSRSDTSLAGPKMKSPAAANPPPTTIASGLKTLTRLAIPEPSFSPTPLSSSSACASPSFARRTRRCASAAGPKVSRASSSAALPETYDSRWPLPPHRQGTPSWTMTMWPISAPAPNQPR